jgi:allophanate hydrolase subunit 2
METDLLLKSDLFFRTPFAVGARNDRMGIKLEGERLAVRSTGRLPSAPVFPGTVQCPEDGLPFLLSADAPTSGGYPRVAQVSRVARHLIGQLRQGDRVRFLLRSDDVATSDLKAKRIYWRQWLVDVSSVI